MLVVSLGSKLKIEMLKAIRDCFIEFRVADFGNPYENLSRLTMMPDNFADSKKVQTKVVEYFSTFDPSIVDFKVEKNKVEEGEDETAKVYAIHRISDSNEAIGIPLNQESDGTQKMFALYPVLKRTLDSGGALFIDELNSRLHPLLVRNILVTFLNPQTNRKHAQIIFTTHDAWQLANDLLRRDEIWFTDKDKEGATTLYSLADFYDEDGVKIRKDENFEKNYLLGKYGAIPDLKAIELL